MGSILDSVFVCDICDEMLINNNGYGDEAVMSYCDGCSSQICYDCLQSIEGFEDITSPNPFYVEFNEKDSEHYRECPKCNDKIKTITSGNIYAYGRFMMRKNGIETLSQLRAAMQQKKD